MLSIFKDPTTSNPPLYRYLGCILLRLSLAILFLNENINLLTIQILSLLAIILFGLKAYNVNKSWKNFNRVVLVYSLILVLSIIKPENYRTIIGLLIIIDALLGLNTRHCHENMSRIN